ncbi:hypothetical protein SAMD00019534_124180 [Acytostelium subglobosum LB1]|uniref:hypothetical protein n=1 Tax=Acytostelium subglobosum LB1 TaxID=1410327 RepID=UPI000644EC21|nr:hypothetical protein SAMD00019534_124180 [Acytostelium subglobosum LB1]GAM29242.1 hypothetical protein SAMD00019534_124180 [Acytostelium subglobosum LB1]|eukprot:XP_012747816.1 hypothetical protein SAMD00019534_124180 [Acytostelium subglobosum LB1]
MQSYCQDKIKDRANPIVCPTPTCKTEVVPIDIQILVGDELYLKYSTSCLDRLISTSADFALCTTPNCEYAFINEGDVARFECPKCKKVQCLKCKTAYHEGTSCEKYQQWLKENGQGDTLFEKVVQEKGFRKCPKCSATVEKREGCNHMTCRCQWHFCYRCGGNFPCLNPNCAK